MKPLDHAFVREPTSGRLQTLNEGVHNFFGLDLKSRLRKQKEKFIVKRKVPATPKTLTEAKALYIKAMKNIEEVQDIKFWMRKGVHLLGQYAEILELVRRNQRRFYGSARKYANYCKDLDENLMGLLSMEKLRELIKAARIVLKNKLKK